MAKRKKGIDVFLFRHGIIWWLLIGWYWRPCLYVFFMFVNAIFNVEVRFKKERKKQNYYEGLLKWVGLFYVRIHKFLFFSLLYYFCSDPESLAQATLLRAKIITRSKNRGWFWDK